jgi:phage shock protein A
LRRTSLTNQHRLPIAGRPNQTEKWIGAGSKIAAFDRLKEKVMSSEAVSQAETELLTDDVGDRLAKLEQEDEIDRMLAEMKTRRGVAN